eukprot:gene493-621_t
MRNDLLAAFNELSEEKSKQNHDIGVTTYTQTAPLTTTFSKKSVTDTIQIMGVLGFINLAFSFYLAFGNIESGTCDVSSTVSCSTVIKSSYGEIANVPVAVFGITWNICLLIAIWRIMIEDRITHFITALYIWCSVGIGFVLYFIIAEYLIGAICPFCTIVHVINCVLMYFSFRLYCDLRSPPHIGLVASSLKNYIITGLVFHLLLIGMYNYSSPVTYNQTFAQCLTSKHMVMYGSSSCHACQNQKAMFVLKDKEPEESPWKYIKFVECRDGDACVDKNIQRYPTWIKFSEDGETELARKEGVMNKFELSKMSGCPLDEEQQQEKQNENKSNHHH